MAVVFQKNKKSGITYVYESKSFWDKEKKQSRSQRILIGKLDEFGNIVKTGTNVSDETASDLSMPCLEAKSFGATFLLNQISAKLGIEEDLKKCFPRNYSKILSVVYFLVMEGSSSVFRYENWAERHHLPYSKPIVIEKLFSSVKRENRIKFFHLQSLRRNRENVTIYDASFLSSQSEHRKHDFTNAFNKQNTMEELTVAFAFSGKPDYLPFYYHEQTEVISDMNMLNYILDAMNTKGYENVQFVLGSGFCSIENINALCREKINFLLSVPKYGDLGTEIISHLDDFIKVSAEYDEMLDLSFRTIETFWDYGKDRPFRKSVPKGENRLFIHVFYSRSIGIEDAQFFNYRMAKYQQEIEEDEMNPRHQEIYNRYFEITKTPVKGITARPKKKAIEEAKKLYGYSILISNSEPNPVKAYNFYTNRHMIEHAFSNIKDRLNCNYPVISSSTNLEGKIFLEYLALIFEIYINRTLQKDSHFNKFVMQKVLDDLDMVKSLTASGADLRWEKISDNVKKNYRDFGITGF